MRDFIDFCKFIAVVLACVLASISPFAFGFNWYAEYQCNNYWAVTGRATRYVAFDACYVQTDNGFQRWDEYKLRAAASEGLGALKGGE